MHTSTLAHWHTCTFNFIGKIGRVTCSLGDENNNECTGMNVYAVGGTPNDVTMECDNEEHICNNANIFCNDNFNQQCSWIYDDDGWYCDGYCDSSNTDLPTLMPSMMISTTVESSDSFTSTLILDNNRGM